MPYNEDAQPNEVRHARKGNAAVPTIRSTAQPRIGPQSHRGRGSASRAGQHRGRLAPLGRSIQGRGGYTSRGNSRDRGRYHGSPRDFARGSAGQRAVSQDRSSYHSPIRRENSQIGRYNARSPAKRPKLEDTPFAHAHGEVIRGVGASGSSYGRPITVPELAEPIPLMSNATRMSDVRPLSENRSTPRPLRPPPGSPSEVSSLGARQYQANSANCATADSVGSAGPCVSEYNSDHERSSAIPLDSLQLVKFDEEVSAMSLAMPSPALPRPRGCMSSTPSIAPSLDVAERIQPQNSETPMREQTQFATGDLHQDPNSTRVTERVARFRSGRLRFAIPRRRHADPESPAASASDTHPFKTMHALGPGRHSISPELPDILDLLQDNIVEDSNARSAPSDPRDFDAANSDAVEVIQMRVEPHDKPRRLFVCSSSAILSITMRGSLDLVEKGPLRRTALRTAGAGEGSRPLVDDACLLRFMQDDLVVLGRVGDAEQLSVVRIQDKHVADIGVFDRPSQPGKRGGISAMCALPHIGTFVTGGYDHVVHRWLFSEEHGATPTPLAIRHTSTIQSLLHVYDTSDKLLCGSADCSVSVYDISSERVVNLLKLSNSVYQVHAAPSPSCALLEVGHRELQFEVRDFRLVPTAPVIRFGYPNVKVHGRYTRGAVRDHVFACGGSEKDGCVRLWDLRKPTEVLKSTQCFPGRKAIQVVFDDLKVIACSEDHQLALLSLSHLGCT